MTDYNGNWSLNNLRQGAVLVFSSIGYATEEVTVGSQAELRLQIVDKDLVKTGPEKGRFFCKIIVYLKALS